MSTVAIDTHRLLRALKSTGKSANFTAEEIADAVDVAQEGGEWVTRSHFDATMAGVDARMAGVDARMASFEARMDRLEARMDVFDAKIDAMRADIKAEVKSSQMQNLLWLSGIMLVSNGAVIAVLARAARLF
ncbi:MAG: hypothetical protein ACYC9Z_09940 [Casimicrobiaceae bacterium]